MEIIYCEEQKYSTKCPECYETIKFKINSETLNFSGNCINGHYFDNLSLEQFKNNSIKPTNSSNLYCYNCYCLINEQLNNFICEECAHVFCNNCINIHSKETKHNIRSNYINYHKLCQLHKMKYNLFCKDCKINICNKCKESHRKHNTKSFIELIPNSKEIESINQIIKSHNEKIEFILNKIIKFKEEFDVRYEKLKRLLHFFKESINEKLLKEFNYSFFDYYNYKNFKYCINYMNEENIFQNQNYLEYLIYGNFSEEIQSENDKVKNENICIKSIKNKEEYYIKHNNSNLKYFKENIFYKTESVSKNNFGLIKFFEFKEGSLQYLLSFNLDDLGRIQSLKSAKYKNNILINFKLKKNIKILEYDNNNKTFSLSKNEIKSIRLFSKNFQYYIDDKEGNIITSDGDWIELWKKSKKKKI